MQLEKMITEGSNTASAEIDRVSTLEMCRIINDEDKTVPLAVERVCRISLRRSMLSTPRSAAAVV